MTPATRPADEVGEEHLPSEAEITGWIEQIVSRGVRRPGYEADAWAEQWAAARLREFGLEQVALEEVYLPKWVPDRPARLEAWPTKHPEAAIHVEGLALPHSRPVPDGLEAELVVVKPESRPDNAVGVMALVELELLRMPVRALRDRATDSYDPDGHFEEELQVLPFGANFQQVMEPAVGAGAAGFVGALTGMPWETSDYYVPYDAIERPIPGMWISASSGGRLLALSASGPVRARVTTSSRREPAITHNVVATLQGSSNYWIVIASHHDAPWASAVEDASGTALVLAQASYWSRLATRQRPHNLLFLLTSGHMAGAAGTRSFIDHHRDLLAHTVLEIHLEHAARRCQTDADRLVPTDLPEPRWWFTSRHSQLEALVGQAIRTEDLRRSLVLPPDVFFENPPTDGAFFHPEGVPIVQYLTAPMYLFDSQDTLDKIHTPTLVPLTRAIARLVRGTEGARPDSFRTFTRKD